MTRILNGRELADFIKERQAHQVRGLIQHDRVKPKLAIIQTVDNPVIDTYVRLKQQYGADILVDVEVHKIPQSDAQDLIAKLNNDDTVHGIIVQLPLENPEQTDEIVNVVTPKKDVDGLGENAILDPATPMAINWLLAGYNIDLERKKIVIVGNGRLVGKPLARMWRNSGYNVEVLNSKTENMPEKLRAADVIVTATGVPNLIKSDDVKIGAIVVDAGTAAEHGKIVGDVSHDLQERGDITITPEKGGVGPLTIVALMDNVIRAARATIK
ncbi:bifunctional 5,10-methylenetetrahydrofolate dehydrogenase/5,10-methenyltetrahydrofolate cyclohydrolase [Candidatus Saccharibacteria bacterium]|nr:bifunctional 5,10-methylenetetrahydrofolate dehydrogenase/5,10-methenyltetrahydrofolate cyclohydrolase [Candidatus Saccharibacteria bacterium]MCL1962719.1 bifunctional 5,10-methylenetetrahydrofolate dehydrogenase/5,10-methenyltetrahydrofolate cyclohydrolase [Candidatus Saccharibacteria bacterium]